MGNKGSTDSAPSLTPVQQREVRAACDLASCIPALLLVVFIFYQENLYEDYVTPALSSVSGGRAPGPAATGGSGTPPILTRPHTEHRRPQQGLERRSMTVVGRGGDIQRRSDAALRRQSTSDSLPFAELPAKQDTLEAHIIESSPQQGVRDVELATSIAVTFDRNVLTVNASKLFEVRSEMDVKPVEGHVTFDPRALRAEFSPTHTLHPGTTYTVTLYGRAITTPQCPSSGAAISNALLSFHTCTPPPKNIGIKLKGERETEKLQIADFYDLYNSLVVWSTKQWGCSGEHIVGMYVEAEDRGKLQPLKADHDVLRLRDDDIVVVDIKD
ncbi:hypothetical protein GBAR_LOCUS20294 [Geodia barretti]|uniref:SbsA Ig-like domain-containing protein n=1 Tax=Geodia barretti TaxID=519541 RepID=A0AA35SU27_GEOBA|nr:hypothetical protein GBAR_LOCUS20294 [Geodia barretti]